MPVFLQASLCMTRDNCIQNAFAFKTHFENNLLFHMLFSVVQKKGTCWMHLMFLVQKTEPYCVSNCFYDVEMRTKPLMECFLFKQLLY